jgi:hypothetical protein
MTKNIPSSRRNPLSNQQAIAPNVCELKAHLATSITPPVLPVKLIPSKLVNLTILTIVGRAASRNARELTRCNPSRIDPTLTARICTFDVWLIAVVQMVYPYDWTESNWVGRESKALTGAGATTQLGRIRFGRRRGELMNVGRRLRTTEVLPNKGFNFMNHEIEAKAYLYRRRVLRPIVWNRRGRSSRDDQATAWARPGALKRACQITTASLTQAPARSGR